MTVSQVVEISKEEYEEKKQLDANDLLEYAADKAIAAGYHPAGYDCRNPKLFEKDGKYFLRWDRSASCD